MAEQRVLGIWLHALSISCYSFYSFTLTCCSHSWQRSSEDPVGTSEPDGRLWSKC